MTGDTPPVSGVKVMVSDEFIPSAAYFCKCVASSIPNIIESGAPIGRFLDGDFKDRDMYGKHVAQGMIELGIFNIWGRVNELGPNGGYPLSTFINPEPLAMYQEAITRTVHTDYPPTLSNRETRTFERMEGSQNDPVHASDTSSVAVTRYESLEGALGRDSLAGARLLGWTMAPPMLEMCSKPTIPEIRSTALYDGFFREIDPFFPDAFSSPPNPRLPLLVIGDGNTTSNYCYAGRCVPSQADRFECAAQPRIDQLKQPVAEGGFGWTDVRQYYVRGVETNGDDPGPGHKWAVCEAMKLLYPEANPPVCSSVGG